ncbi:MAG: tRNA glutamyl-Q(34) synthetase GluQRS [Pseudomonadota bacterium]
MPDCPPNAVLRFAPSPNGYLHLGHALSALICQQWADALGGHLLLRIEDTDLSRARPNFVDAIHEDLAWLGIRFDGPTRVQSQHLGLYDEALRSLYQRGFAYPAPASRKEMADAVTAYETDGRSWPRDPDGSPHYPFRDRDLAARPERMPDEQPIRLNMEAACKARSRTKLTVQTMETPHADPVAQPLDPSLWGDVLLRGRDRPATYHLAVVVDDAAQRVTHVVRGKDLEAATSLHRLLQELMDLPAPIYHHHHLVMGEDGRKLSKSEGAKSLRVMREAGETPADIRRHLMD